MPLPPNMTQSDFDAVMAEFAAIVGADWAFTNPDYLSAYADPFSPRIGNGQPLPSGVVAPQTSEQVQAVMRVASAAGVPVWVVSTGKNFGYGGCEALVPGSVIIDLKRMDQIIEVNEDLAYAVVEPGVSQYQLWQHIQDQGLNLWVDGPSPAWASVVANSIERGVGYGPKGDRFAQVCGMEVVLPEGDIMRTGMGALEGSPSFHTFSYGLGPVMDGLFSQSNYGVVTKIGIHLNPMPECYRSIAIDTVNYAQVVDLIDTLRPLRIGGVVRTAASIIPKMPPGMGPGNFGGGPGEGPPGAPPGPPDPAAIYQMIDGNVKWRLRIGLTGHKAQVEADWQKIYTAFRDGVEGCQIGSDYYEAPYDYEQMDTLGKLHAAVPSMQETEVWQHGALFVSTVLPSIGSEFWRQVEVMRRAYGEFGMPYIGSALHFHQERSVMCLLGAPIMPGNVQQNEMIMTMGRRIIEVAAQNGWAEYRTPTNLMQPASDVFAYNDHALRRLQTKIKDALDPAGILAPGKNGIWPGDREDG